MAKLLINAVLMLVPTLAFGETWVCSSSDRYIHTLERKPQAFEKITRAVFDDLPTTTLPAANYTLLHESSEWLVLSQIQIDEVNGAAILGMIINKNTGKYVLDSVRSIEFEARKEFGDCVET